MTPAGRRALDRGLVRALQALGPAFVKAGQIAAMRNDALPPNLCRELSRLHDAVAPMATRDAAAALRSARAATPALRDAAVELHEPIGSGSIACVYRGLLPDGRAVAVKLKRPGVDRRMARDLRLLQAAAQAGARLPRLRGMPIADLVGYVSRAILGQLDFGREARHSTEIRAALAAMPGVHIPAVRAELSGPGWLVFEHVAGLDAATPSRLPAALRAEAGARVLEAVHTLFFEHGLVHCDLHPGNLYVTHEGHVVLLDAGYCVRLPDRVRRLIGGFFVALAAGDGRRCGEIVLASAVHPCQGAEARRFVAELAALVGHAGSGVFDMSSFGDAVYALQQRHRLYAASDFAFPLMSVLVVEGTVRRFWPEADIRAVGVAQDPRSRARGPAPRLSASAANGRRTGGSR